MKLGVERIEAEAMGDVLQRAEGAVVVGGIIAPTARDTGNTPQTILRAGLVLGRTDTGLWREFGGSLKEVEKAAATGSGHVYKLADAHIVPYSETLYDRYGGTDTEIPRTSYHIDYVSGVVVLAEPLEAGHSLVASYVAVDPAKADGSEYPLGVLLNPVNLLNVDGVPVPTSAQILLAGFVKAEKLIVAHPKTLKYAKQALSGRMVFLEAVENY